MTHPQPDFTDDVDTNEDAVNTALAELAKVKAYAMTPSELRDLKAAQYALRNLSPDFNDDYDPTEPYPEGRRDE